MSQKQLNEKSKTNTLIHRFTTARRTVTETDIVNFVNLVGLHEPYFIDMEFIKEVMSGEHQRRFAPATLIISIGMGLVAPKITEFFARITEGENAGPLGGLTGINARVLAAVYPGDTLQVDVEGKINKRTSKGHLLVDIRHIIKNQENEVVLDFAETVIFTPPGD